MSGNTTIPLVPSVSPKDPGPSKRVAPDESVSPPTFYAYQVLAYSKIGPREAYYSGAHYGRLGKFLISQFQQFGNQGTISETNHDYITYYDLSKDFGSGERRTSFSTIDTFAAHLKKGQETANIGIQKTDTTYSRNQDAEDWNGRLLFIKGFPSPQWLNEVGASLDMDPELLFRHLTIPASQLSQSTQYNHQFYLPPHTNIDNIIKLKIYNTGSWDTGQSQHNVGKLRRLCNESMDRHLDNIMAWRNIAVGHSLVRRFLLHDVRRFSLEQQITVEVISHTKTWSIVVFSDSGSDLSLCAEGPWTAYTDHGVTLNPVYQHKQRSGLNDVADSEGRCDTRCPNHVESDIKFPQSIFHLDHNYGRDLKAEIMAQDAFYALHELFAFSAASIHQLLELVEDSIRTIMKHNNSAELPELLVAKGYVDDIFQSARENLEIIKARGGSSWPRTKSKELEEKAERAARHLEKTYSQILWRCEECSNQCSNGITILSHVSAREQTQKAIEQTDKVTKLSFLAYLFVPMSFTTSFFGMNFRELGEENSLWIFFTTAVPIVVLSLIVWYFSVGDFLARSWSKLTHKLFRAPVRHKRQRAKIRQSLPT